jgi:hypothetical protein
MSHSPEETRPQQTISLANLQQLTEEFGGLKEDELTSGYVRLMIRVAHDMPFTPPEAVEEAIQAIAGYGLRSFAFTVHPDDDDRQWLVMDGRIIGDEELDALAAEDEDDEDEGDDAD